MLNKTRALFRYYLSLYYNLKPTSLLEKTLLCSLEYRVRKLSLAYYPSDSLLYLSYELLPLLVLETIELWDKPRVILVAEEIESDPRLSSELGFPYVLGPP